MEEDEYYAYCPECDWTGLSSECRLADDSTVLASPDCMVNKATIIFFRRGY